MPGGRPSKLEPEAVEKIIRALQVGAPAELAARGAGISLKTFNRWLAKGESQRRGHFRDFYLQVVETQNRSLLRWLAVIDKAASSGDWKAAAWKAEHAHPEFFGKVAAVPPDGGANQLPPYEAMIEALERNREEREQMAEADEAEESGDDSLRD